VQEALDPAATRQLKDFRGARSFWQWSMSFSSSVTSPSPILNIPRTRRPGRRQLAAEIEELILDLLQHLVQPAVALAAGATSRHPLRVEHAREPDRRVEFVDGAVRRDARRVLRHAPAAHERRLTAVPRARVYRVMLIGMAASRDWRSFYLNDGAGPGMIGP